MSVQVIASSSSGNAYALHPEGGAPLLLEAGIRFKDIQVALKHRVSSLAGCLVSHEHLDHGRAAAEVMKAGVNVYATRGTLAALNLAGYRARALPKLETVRIDDWSVMAFPAKHDAAEPCGFLIGHGEDRILYVTDTSYCAYTFPGLTLALVEANYSSEVMSARVAKGDLAAQQAARVIRNHLSLENCVRLLQANDLSRVREVHLLHLSAGSSDAEAFKDAVARATGKPVYVAAERAQA